MPPTDFQELACEIIEQALCAFSESVQYQSKSGDFYTIRGIFDNQFEQVDPDTEIVVASQTPMLGVKNKDLKEPPKKGDHVKIREVLYRVIDSQEDGIAATTLILHKVGC